MNRPRIALFCNQEIDRFSASDAVYQVPLRLAERARVTLFTTAGPVKREPLASKLERQVVFSKGQGGYARLREEIDATESGAERWRLVISGVDASSVASALALRKSLGLPWISVCEDHPYGSRYRRPGPVRMIERAVRTRMLRSMLSSADRMVYFINPGVCDFLGLDPSRTVHLTNSADLETIEPVRMEADAMRAEGSGTPPVIAYVGVVNEDKGAFEMLDVLRRVRMRMPHVRLRLIGEVDRMFESRFHARIRELGLDPSVEITGLLSPVDALRQAAGAALCLHAYRPLPWLYWNQPLKICEYLALGRTFVSWDYPGVRDLVAGRRCGLLVPQGDIDSMAGAVVELLAGHEARAAMELEALERSREISWSVTGDRLWRMIQPLMGQGRDV